MSLGMSHNEQRSRTPRWVLGISVALVLGCAVWYAVYSALKPPARLEPVAFSDFISQVRSGKVDEITIRDRREYVFRTRQADGGILVQEAIGPVADDALIASLKPSDERVAPPKIRVE
jgi:hypothetical protein